MDYILMNISEMRIKNGLEQYIEVNPGYRKMRIQFDFNPMHVF